MVTALFLNDLADQCSRHIKQPLPAEFYKPIFEILATEYEGIAPERQRQYLAASVGGLVAFSARLLPHLPKQSSPFSIPLSELLPHTLKHDLYEDLGHLFGSVYGWSERRYVHRNYVYMDEDDEKERDRRRKEDDKIYDDYAKDVGPEYYSLLLAVNRSPFYPNMEKLGKVFDIPVPLALDEERRFEHTWVMAAHGSGKTNLLENLILHDLKKQASIVVIDSQNELIPKIASVVPPARLIYLEPDPQHPLALNIFDSDQGEGMNANDQEVMHTTALEMAQFILAGLLKGTLTAKQGGVFRSLMEAMAVIPGATLRSFQELLTEDGYQRFKPYIPQLDEYSQRFFLKEFMGTGFKTTKEEIYWRLHTILSQKQFYRIFSHPKNRLNLFNELQAGKVVLINTNVAMMGHEATGILGRFFLALIMQAAQRRLLMPKAARLPTYVYVDEAQEYIAEEPMIARLIDQARKQRVAFTFSHQRLAQITDPNVRDALEHVYTKLIPAGNYRFQMTQGGKSHTVTTALSPLQIDQNALEVARRAMVERYCAPPVPTPPIAEVASPEASPMEAENVVPMPAKEPKNRKSIPKALPKDDVDINPGEW